MASLHRHSSGRSPFWWAKFRGPDGRVVFRSTKKKKKSDAWVVALGWEHASAMGRDGILTEAQCRRVLSEILERVTGETIRQTSTEKFFNEWLDGKEAARSKNTAVRYRGTTMLFLDHLGERANRPLGGVTPRDIQNFLNRRLKEKVAPKTAILDIKILNNAFNRALRQGLIPSNPVVAVELPKIVSSERGVFTPAQIRTLVDAAPSTDWKTAILLGYYTGARLRDCVSMGWENVDLATEVLTYEPQKTSGTTKNGNKVTVPLHPELAAHLSALASSDAPVKLLCPSLAVRETGGAHGLSSAFKAIMGTAGVDSQMIAGQGRRKFSKLSFHSLRHSFNSALANAGVVQEIRMKLTGHKSVGMNSRYTHHEISPLKVAINHLPTLNGAGTATDSGE